MICNPKLQPRTPSILHPKPPTPTLDEMQLSIQLFFQDIIRDDKAWILESVVAGSWCNESLPQGQMPTQTCRPGTPHECQTCNIPRGRGPGRDSNGLVVEYCNFELVSFRVLLLQCQSHSRRVKHAQHSIKPYYSSSRAENANGWKGRWLFLNNSCRILRRGKHH